MTIIQGDSLEELKKLEADSIDLVCTDPPYGYSFMGKDWDKAVPSVEIWKECLRVLKAGAFCFVMSAPRSDVQNAMISRLMEAGFRLDFTPIYWTYASGFPKAGNIGKLVDKRLGAEREVVGTRNTRVGQGQTNTFVAEVSQNVEVDITKPSSDQAKALDGSYAGFQPKPAVEVIIVAMKPLSEKTYVDQALKNGKGITWLDDVRIPIAEGDDNNFSGSIVDNGAIFGGATTGHARVPHNAGRFPANLLVSDDVLNDGVERKSGARNGANNINSMENSVSIGNGWQYSGGPSEASSGSYSRYFDLDKWANTLPFLIVPKASKSEKNKGLGHLPLRETVGEGKNTFKAGLEFNIDPRSPNGGYEVKHDTKMNNHHPTVKPLKLMSYLITLGSRENDIVLDPFCGSGTTCLAAKKLGRGYIGIEREAEYVEIAKARLDADKQGVLL